MSTTAPIPPTPSASPALADAAGEREGPMTWAEVCQHPALRDLPFKIELDRYGRILMSPPFATHARRQYKIARLLDDLLGGVPATECPVETSEGVKVPDVVWLSDDFAEEYREAKVYAVAPPVCVEIMSPSNPWAEMEEKTQLYLARGAREVWICEPDGRLRFFAHEGEIERSRLAPEAPDRIDL